MRKDALPFFPFTLRPFARFTGRIYLAWRIKGTNNNKNIPILQVSWYYILGTFHIKESVIGRMGKGWNIMCPLNASFALCVALNVDSVSDNIDINQSER